MRRGCVARVIVMVLLAATTEGAQPAPSAKTAPRDCAGLAATPLAGARITAADAVTTSQAIPVPHCKVLGVIDTEVRFQVLHPDLWNGRFVMGGNGGFAGSLDSEVISSVRLGYAAWTAKTGGEVFHAAEWEYAGTP